MPIATKSESMDFGLENKRRKMLDLKSKVHHRPNVSYQSPKNQVIKPKIVQKRDDSEKEEEKNRKPV